MSVFGGGGDFTHTISGGCPRVRVCLRVTGVSEAQGCPGLRGVCEALTQPLPLQYSARSIALYNWGLRYWSGASPGPTPTLLQDRQDHRFSQGPTRSGLFHVPLMFRYRGGSGARDLQTPPSRHPVPTLPSVYI